MSATLVAACTAFAIFGYAYGRLVGFRHGRRVGFMTGQRHGAFWQRWGDEPHG